jgi:enoyl-CoA hydratase/carnithine racemase
MTAPVLFEELATSSGALIGVATLNSEKTLNALNLDMVDLLAAQFSAWAHDPEVVMVMLQGAGDKALCAGGDLHGLYKTMLQHHASSRRDDPLGNQYAADFFLREYRLDYQIHTFPKPVLCWGHGIVMGGGVGLMSGASHRVVTERSRIAMPEINIGLYPDVGGSWILSRVPGNAGLFLALTGAPLNASDALFAGMADYFVAQDKKPLVVQHLKEIAWTGERAEDDQRLAKLLFDLGDASLPPGPLQENMNSISALCAHADLEDIAAGIAKWNSQSVLPSESGAEPSLVQRWIEQAAKSLAAGCPGTARLAFSLQKRARGISLAEVFRMEYIVSLHCATHTDFAEGIRALLIDKDKSPRWNPSTLAEATGQWVEWFFESPWPKGGHPLADLR